MTEDNFIALHFPNGQENTPGSIHLNINQVGSTTQGLISSIIITVNAKSIDGQTNNTYIENLLEQITSLKFTFDENTYELFITSRAYYPATNPFFYYTVEPAYVPDMFDPDTLISSEEQVAFTPTLLNLQFGFSEFNPLIGNASENRKSDRVMVSDRLERTVTPSNITALLSSSAAKASIQDSLYSDSGWVNARYKGSITNAQKSAGVSPTLTGRTFTGEVFPSGSNTNYICNLTDRLEQELFHTADSTLPDFNITDFSVTLASTFGSAQTILTYSTLSDNSSGSLDIGDVLRTDSTPAEYLKIQGINNNTQKITVRRDLYNAYPTTKPSYTSGSIFNRVARFDIFRFGLGQNKIQLVNNSRIYVNGNNTIIDTDDYGQILSSSIC